MKGLVLLEKVSIVECDSYDYKKVEKKVFECLDNIDSLKKQIKKTKVNSLIFFFLNKRRVLNTCFFVVQNFDSRSIELYIF